MLNYFSMDKPVNRAHRIVDQWPATIHRGLTTALPHELAGARARGCSEAPFFTASQRGGRVGRGGPHR
jgi:hypothetical protein